MKICPNCEDEDGNFEREVVIVGSEEGYFDAKGEFQISSSECPHPQYIAITVKCLSCLGLFTVDQLINKEQT